MAAGKAAAHQTKHTVPLTSAPAKLFAANMSRLFLPRMGIGLTLQQATGLRPSELLHLKKCHVLRPPQDMGRFVLRLGANVGTKVKREQVAFLDSFKHTDIAFLLCMLLDACTHDDEFLFPYSYNKYNRTIATIEADLGLDLGVTPHSPRAGFASEAVSLGEPVLEVKEAGRWLSDVSFKSHIDVAMAAQVQALMALQGYREGMHFVVSHFTQYFSSHDLFAEVHGAKGLDQEPGGHLRAEGDALPSWGGYKDLHSRAQPARQEVFGNRSRQQPADVASKGRAKGGADPPAGGKGKGKGSSKLVQPKQCR